MQRPLIVLVVAALGIAPGAAYAQDAKKDAAELAFREAQTLTKAGKHAEACPKFEESQRLDPAIGTLLNLARCYEAVGRVASAWRTYGEAEKLAKAKKDKRAKGARDLASKLEAKLPRLVIDAPAAPADLAITIGGAPFDLALLGVRVPTDPGAVVVEARAKGYEPFTATAELAVGATITVEVKLTEQAIVKPEEPEPKEPVVQQDEPEEPLPDPEPEPERGSSGGGRRILGLSLGGAGVLAIGGGVFLALQARGDYDAAFEGSADAAPHCDPVTLGCDAQGQRMVDDAHGKANLAGIVGGVGVAVLATGVFLYLTAPSGEEARTAYVVPTVGDDAIGVAFGGSL